MVTSDGSAVLSAGATRLELWRSDLIRMLSYGEIDAPVKPVNTKLGTGCARCRPPAARRVGVLEACPGKQDLRLTLLKPAKEEDEPDAKHVELLGWRSTPRPGCWPRRPPPPRCICRRRTRG